MCDNLIRRNENQFQWTCPSRPSVALHFSLNFISNFRECMMVSRGAFGNRCRAFITFGQIAIMQRRKMVERKHVPANRSWTESVQIDSDSVNKPRSHICWAVAGTGDEAEAEKWSTHFNWNFSIRLFWIVGGRSVRLGSTNTFSISAIDSIHYLLKSQTCCAGSAAAVEAAERTWTPPIKLNNNNCDWF